MLSNPLAQPAAKAECVSFLYALRFLLPFLLGICLHLRNVGGYLFIG
jgi:hypothetical protein